MRIFFSLLIRMEEIMRDFMRMIPNTRLEVTYLAKTYTRKLAHLNTFKAF